MRDFLLLAACLLISSIHATAADAIDFNRDVKPILAKNCFACHGPDDGHRKAGLRLDLRDEVVKHRKHGAAIVPGKTAESLLIERITATEEAERMPPKETGDALTKEQINTLKRWIENGAPYAEHWAFVKPKRFEPPTVSIPAWSKNPVDGFIFARLEKAGLKPSPQADRFILLRRASLDLRGLPPSVQEIDEFAKDTSADAYEKMVERFLKDAAYGERWARMWLDLARYADSAGYGSDPLRPNMWRYRDWLIEAFNKNLPYDRFTIEQLAGDLLPNATMEQRMATAFHRNTMTNTEGGTDDEEFRVVAVKDRVDTTMQVWMGLTMGCAKCHDHKFDPIKQKEYYGFYAFFNQTADADRGDEAPVMPAPTAEYAEKLKQHEARVAELKAKLADWPKSREEAFHKWEQSLLPRVGGQELNITSVSADSKARFSKTESGRWRIDRPTKEKAKLPEKDAYTITATGPRQDVTAFKIEVPWHTDHEYVLRNVHAHVGVDGKAPVGRIVRVELPGNNKILSLAEVQVLRGGTNIALKGSASQSSTDYGGTADRANDGNTEGEFNKANSVTHTATEKNPWWEVKLAEAGPVERITIWNRRDGVESRLSNFRVSLLTEDRKVVWSRDVTQYPNPSAEWALAGAQPVAIADAYSPTSDEANAPSVLDAKGKGWGGNNCKGENLLYLVLERPLSLDAATPLTFRFDVSGLEHFNIQTVTDKGIAARLANSAEARRVLSIPESSRTPQQTEILRDQFRTLDPTLKQQRDEIAKLEKAKPEMPTLPIMQELPAAQQRKTHVMVKGNFLDKGEEVKPITPTGLFPFPNDAPLNRLGVAQWIVHPENPMTARVAVNRFWAQLFGRGLVETEEDFGTQGELPTHSELLDWLAAEYIRLGWDTKAFLKLLVTSETYMQSARVTPELLKADPKNVLYSRAPRFRLEAEMVRDQALALSGLLSKRIGGPSVYPPQPAGLWQAAFNGQRTWPTSSGDDKYRRGMYTFWRRTIPYPSMTAFDAPSRETCSIRRTRTNTPLQAFVTLNDPVYVEAAQALARRMVKEGGAKVDERVRFGLKLCLCRPATDAQVQPLLELYQAELVRFEKDAKAAKALATEPIGPAPQGVSEPELAAWTAVANVLLNLDGVLTKN